MSKIEEILEGYKNDQLTYVDREGEHKINIAEFVKTGSDNVLQKLNRTEQVLLKVANAAPEKLKWVNDYAMMQVVKALYERVDDLSTGLIEKDTVIERLNNEATASRVAFETADGISKEEAEKLLERIAGMEADEQILQAQLNQIIVERDELTEKYSTLDERFNKSVEAYKALKTTNEELNNKLTNSSAEMDTQYNELAKMYEKLNNKYESLQSEAAVVNDRHNETMKQYEHDVESLKTRLENAAEENLKLNDKIAELQQIKTDIMDEFNKYKSETENNMNESENTINELIKMKEDLQQECNNYAGEFEKASARCQEIDSRNEELQTEYDKQQDLISKLEEQYNNTCERNIELKSELDTIKDNFSEATDRIRNLDSTNVEYQNKITELDNLVKSLHEAIEEMTNEFDECKKILEEKTKENSLLNARIKHNEDYEERTNVLENAISKFINDIGLDLKTQEMEQKPSTGQNQHRMGDNQVVDFNLGM